jgi:hypothetical protein
LALFSSAMLSAFTLTSLPVEGLPLSHFRDCIGPNLYNYGTGSGGLTCTLDAGTYSIGYSGTDDDTNKRGPALAVTRSGVIATGTYNSSIYDTTLQRVCPSGESSPCSNSTEFIMVVGNGTSGSHSNINATVEYFTFDGNRGTVTSSSGETPSGGCIDLVNYYYYDLFGAYNDGVVVVTDNNFIRAPGYSSVWLGGASAVTYSTFAYYNTLGTGSTCTTVNGSTACEANRFTAIAIGGSSTMSNYNGVWYNTIYYSGTAALSMQGPGQSGSGQYIYGNTIELNRYEMSDGGAGGQIVINSGATGVSTASNVINGGYWITPSSGPVGYFQCNAPSPTQGSLGIETYYGGSHGFYNNSIIQHAAAPTMNGGAGMTLASVDGVTIYGSYNPWNPSDPAKTIEDNTLAGIFFFDSYPSSGVTLDGIRAIYNGYSGQTNYAGVYFGSGTTGTGFDSTAVYMCNNNGRNSLNNSSVTYGAPQAYQTCP